MALTPTVELVSVREPQMGRVVVTVSLVVADDSAGPGFTKSYPIDRGTGVSVADLIDVTSAAMQDDIDRYKREQALAQSGGLATAIATLQGLLAV